MIGLAKAMISWGCLVFASVVLAQPRRASFILIVRSPT
jgi:hypothetical protein